MTEGLDHWRLPLAGRVVDRVVIDWAITLHLDDSEGGIEVKVEQPFVAENERGSTRVDPSGDPALLGPAAAVARARVKSAVAFKDGRLELVFESGLRWHVAPSPDFEAWMVTGPGLLRVVGMPGGTVATWGAGES